MKNRPVKETARLLLLALTLAVFATGCSSPRTSSYSKSRNSGYSSYSKSSASCVKSGSCGSYTRVARR